MSTITLKLPDTLAEELKAAEAKTGSDAETLALEALREFLGEHRFALADAHQREDISTALYAVGAEN